MRQVDPSGRGKDRQGEKRGADDVALDPEVGDQTQLEHEDRELRGKQDLLEELTGGVNLFAVYGKKVVAVNQMSEGEEHEASDGDDWDGR